MHSYRAFSLVILSSIVGIISTIAAPGRANAQQNQRLVESVDITGNRRLRKDDILYYVQTRPGDPYNPQQVQRDYQAILALGFFDKTATRVLEENGARGGVNIIFEVKELPIIRDLTFEGLKSVAESDVLKAFRERRVGVSKESIYDPVKVRNAIRVIKELLAAHGHPNATVEERGEEVSATSRAITFAVNEGKRVRVVEVQFEGNTVFSDGKLRDAMKYVKEAGLITRFRGQDILDREKLDVDLRLVVNYMRSKGYLEARVGEPRIESVGPRRTGFFLPIPFLSSTDEGLRVIVPILEGKLYRLGDMKIEGNSIFSEAQIKAIIGLNKGDIANGEKISKGLFENLKKYYGRQGFIEYSPEPVPTYKDNPQNPNEGIVDFVVTIEEGKQFNLRRLEFIGNTFTRDNVLRREVLINEGDVYDEVAWEYSVVKLNQLGYFNPIDKDKDADRRTNEEEATVDIGLKVSERGRQQISFNGGISGIGGSFFGLDYSTNNLLGRGEVLSLNLAGGNRQRYFQFSFTEPYINDRPISAGFSLFAFTQKFFGEGTFLSQNINAQQDLINSQANLANVNEANLFTRTSYGSSLFASAPLSEFYRKRRFTQFSRVGASYQFSISSVKDPTANADPTATGNFIPVIYSQPNIVTSRATLTFSYDTRNANIDPTTGRELSVNLALAGLGGDVRTYQPTLSYTQFFPMRRKKSPRPEVFGFRILAGSVGSFATSSKVRNANSLAFVDGVPIFERFFLGDEFTIRGYNVRSISPAAPVDTFITSKNVVIASNPSGAPVQVPGLPASLATVGVFTGFSGNNVAALPSSFTSVGGDTQLLGNFEYRIPIISDMVSLAAFADIGSAFNLRTNTDQRFSSNFLDDQPFLSTVGFIRCPRRDSPVGAGNGFAPISLSSLAGCITSTELGMTGAFGLIARDNRLVTQAEVDEALKNGAFDPFTGLPIGFQQVFLRGQAQTNTQVRLSQSLFAKIGDYRSSLGMEVRVQVPVINVPFRLIFAYNPNARKDQVINGFPFFFGEKKRVIRFSVGRTF